MASTALVVGCGALGSVISDTLARAGVGRLRLVDRDFVELNNLQRQSLYDEADAAAALPKAIAAAAHLRQANSTITIEPFVRDVDAASIGELCDGVDVILDGTDNFETRFLLNDVAIARGIPWIYGGCLGAAGQTMTIVPGRSPCLRCLMGDGPPPPGVVATCDTAGILAPVVNVIASIQSCEAIKILTGHLEAVSDCLTAIDLWDGTLRQLRFDGLSAPAACPTCQERRFDWLEGRAGLQATILCGRQSVQIKPSVPQSVDLAALAQRFRSLGEVQANEYLARVAYGPHSVTVFADGRAIIGGTNDLAQARSIHARTVGA